jgi:3-isopropylmalate/(R)-2-methylmalate dehydratase small subunit
MATFTTLTSRAVALPMDDVDTDQIIPARFLKVTDKASLGANLFSDWREKPDFVLNRPEAEGAQILVAGRNFGCGSSREHAPWAMLGHGFRAVVSSSFADIFRANALKNGLLPVEVDDATHARLLAEPGTLTIDLASTTLTLEDGTQVTFPIDPFAQKCLLEGLDELTYLLSHLKAVEAHEARRL